MNNEEIAEILHALGLMYSQYCSEHGHRFMTAGEVSCLVLERYGMLSGDDIGRGEVNYDHDHILQTLNP